MKKIVSLVLMVALLINISAVAWEFDISVFENNEHYKVDVDEFIGNTLITNSNNSDETFFPFENKSFPYVQISPVIQRNDNNTDPMMYLYIYYYGEDWLFFDRVYFKIDDTTYEHENLTIALRDVQKKRVVEAVIVGIFGTNMYQMMDAIANTDEEIRVRFSGEKGNIDFTLDKTVQEHIAEMYTLFLQAGAQSARDLYVEDIT